MSDVVAEPHNDVDPFIAPPAHEVEKLGPGQVHGSLQPFTVLRMT